MAYYTQLQDHEIQALAARYQLEITSYQPIEQGQGNSNYLFNTKQRRYILTVFEIDSTHVINMCKVLLLLENHDFPAPKIHKLPNGDMLTDHQGKPVMLKPYINGQVVDELDAGQLDQLGSALAQLHQIPVPKGLPDQHGYMLKEVPQVIKKRSDHEFVRWFSGRYRDLMQNIPSDLPTGLIHGDLFYDNVLFEGKQFKALLDFEDICHYYKAFDIGMAIVGLSRHNLSIDLTKARSIVSGYQKIRLLAGAEREILQDFIELAALLTSVWRFWKYNVDLPGTQKSKNYLEMVNIAREIAKIPKTRFLESVL